MTRPSAMPHIAAPPKPCLDPDTAEEETHRWLMSRGITDRETLWCGTLCARAAVWVAHLRAAYQSDRHAESVLQLATREVKVRVLRFQASNPMAHPLYRAELFSQLNRIDYTHLPPDMTRPPTGWMEGPSATSEG